MLVGQVMTSAAWDRMRRSLLDSQVGASVASFCRVQMWRVSGLDRISPRRPACLPSRRWLLAGCLLARCFCSNRVWAEAAASWLRDPHQSLHKAGPDFGEAADVSLRLQSAAAIVLEAVEAG